LKHCTLQQISKSITSGITPFRGNPDFWLNGTILWLKTEQLGERNIYITNEKITKKALSDTSIRLNPANTISIAMYGEGKTRGNISILRTEMTTNQACCNVVLDQTLADTDYIYYFLKNQYWNLRSLSSGVRKNLNSGDIKGFTINLPETVAQQKKIARVLSVLDDKIELNNHINEELEGMAKLLYDYWFVQFDFPITAAQATAMGKPKLEGKPYRASSGAMIYNETLRREIPEGWKNGSLLDVAEFTNGIACQKYPSDGGGTLRVIKIKEMHAGFSADSDVVTVNVPGKIKIKNGDLLFSWSASLEVMIWAGGDGALNQHIFKVMSDTHPRSFCYFVLLDYLQHFRMMAALRKTTMGHITSDHLEQSQIVTPDKDVAQAFELITKPIIERMVKAHEENIELIKLRDWLLPILMNGQVTVD
jgi:type I restriction enzyme S subunit